VLGKFWLILRFPKMCKNNPGVKSSLKSVFNWKRYHFHKSNP